MISKNVLGKTRDTLAWNFNKNWLPNFTKHFSKASYKFRRAACSFLIIEPYKTPLKNSQNAVKSFKEVVLQLTYFHRRFCGKALKKQVTKKRVTSDWKRSSKTKRKDWTQFVLTTRPTFIYLFKANRRNTRKICEICSRVTIKTPERRQWRFYWKLWTYFSPLSSVSIVDFEDVNICWEGNVVFLKHIEIGLRYIFLTICADSDKNPTFSSVGIVKENTCEKLLEVLFFKPKTWLLLNK